MQHGAGAEESDARNNLRCNTRGIAAEQLRDFCGNAHEQRRADADQDVRAKACRLVTNLPLDPDDPAKYGCQDELQWN